MSKNKIGYEKQAKMVVEQLPQPFSYEYRGETIEVNPLLSPSELVNAVSIVTTLVVTPDGYHPELMDFAVRFATASTMLTNVRWDYEKIFDRHYNQLMYTDFYNSMINALAEHGVASVAADIRINAEQKVEYLVALQGKSTVDLMVENLLIKLEDYLDKAAQNLGGTDANAIINAVNTMKHLSDDGELVPKVLEFYEKGDKNELGGSDSTVPND